MNRWYSIKDNKINFVGCGCCAYDEPATKKELQLLQKEVKQQLKDIEKGLKKKKKKVH